MAKEYVCDNCHNKTGILFLLPALQMEVCNACYLTLTGTEPGTDNTPEDGYDE